MFQANIPAFKAMGILPVFVSADSAPESRKTQEGADVPFPVLADPDLAAHRAFAVTNRVDAATYAKLIGYRIHLEKASGRTHHTIAIPSMFLIDTQGVVRFAHADPKYKVRPTTAQVLTAIAAALKR